MIEFHNQPDFPEQHTAVAVGTVNMSQQAVRVLIENATEKASILTIARVAAIQSIKQTANLIPLHLPGRIIGVQVDFDINVELACLKATLTVQANSNGSIATEALTGLNLALLSVYDMMKDVDRNMMLSGIRLESETSSEGRPFLFDNAYENINF